MRIKFRLSCASGLTIPTFGVGLLAEQMQVEKKSVLKDNWLWVFVISSGRALAGLSGIASGG